MRAVVAELYHPALPADRSRTEAARGAGKSAGWGPGGILSLVTDEPVPALPRADGWVRLRPELSGICGSDVGVAHAKSSFVLSAFYSAPRQIPGHEMVAVVERAGPGATIAEGERVAIDPVLSCAHRGLRPLPVLP